jgi:hypothetical protein
MRVKRPVVRRTSCSTDRNIRGQNERIGSLEEREPKTMATEILEDIGTQGKKAKKITRL